MTAAGHGRRHVPASSYALVIAAGVLLIGAWPDASPGASSAAPPGPTGQSDVARVATGELRRALLPPVTAPADDRHPVSRGTITIRSRLPIDAADAAVLLVEFRSRSGERCLGVSVYRPGLVDPPECLHRRGTTYLVVVRGGPLPDSVRVIAGTVGARGDEARVTDARGRVRRYRVSRARVGVAREAAPFLVETTGVRTVGIYRDGVRLEEVRFP